MNANKRKSLLSHKRRFITGKTGTQSGKWIDCDIGGMSIGNFFPSFRRMPESRGFSDLLDTGIRRYDDVKIMGQQCPENYLR